jgi:hypothetical protein
MKSFYRCALLAAAVLAILAQAASAQAELIRAVAMQGGSQFLVSWDSSAPGTLTAVKTINAPNAILGIDTRPATQELYAVSQSKFGIPGSYGISRLVPSGNAMILNEFGSSQEQITGFSHGFDFNPVIDRIRVVNDVNKNYVFDPVTGLVQLVATDLAYGPADPNFGQDPNIAGSAYTNSTVAPPATTQLYGIDTGLNILVTQANNAGTLATVGPLGIDVSALAGFDISGSTGIAYAVMTPAGASQSSFYSINLVTGAATSLGVVGGGIVVTAMTVGVVPEPSTVALASLALLGLCGIRRR